ncbi:MAG: glycine cleavage system protein GcvH [archaeon]
MNPKELKYTKEHEWVSAEGDIATVGITDYAQQQLTDVVFVELPEVGKKVEQLKPLGVIESVKSVSDLFAPIGGVVVEINKELEEHPELVNKDPFGDGWLVRLKVLKTSEFEVLMSAEQYEEFTRE